MAKQMEQDRITADLDAREALLREREATIERDRAAVENHQATVSRLLQQARAESVHPRNAAPTLPAQPPAPPRSVSGTRATLGRPDQLRSNKAGTSTRMFLTAIPVSVMHTHLTLCRLIHLQESMDDVSESDDDPPRSVPRTATTSRPMAKAIGDDVEVHTLTVNQLVEAIRQSLRKEAELSPRRPRRRSATPVSDSEPEVDRETRIELLVSRVDS